MIAPSEYPRIQHLFVKGGRPRMLASCDHVVRAAVLLLLDKLVRSSFSAMSDWFGTQLMAASAAT